MLQKWTFLTAILDDYLMTSQKVGFGPDNHKSEAVFGNTCANAIEVTNATCSCH